MSFLRSRPRIMAVTAFVALGLGLAGTSPASAASNLGLSWDGHTWSGSLTGRLFIGPKLLVPGDNASGRFFVRNMTGDAAMLRVQYRLPRSPLIGPHNVQVTARVGSGSWTPLVADDSWLPVTTTRLDQRAMRVVRVRATFDPRSGNSSQNRVEPVAFRVSLTEAVPGVGTSTAAPSTGVTHAGRGGGGPRGGGTGVGPNGGGGGLPFTGVQVGLLLVLGAALIGAGLALLTGGRLFGRRGEHGG
jgi:hypothetical protein